MDLTIVQVSASLQSTHGLVSSTHVANAVSEALRSCAISIPSKPSNKASGSGSDLAGSPPRPIDSFYHSPQDVTAPPPTRRGTHYSRPRSAPTITKSRRKVRKVTGGGSDDDSEQLTGGGDDGVFWSGGSGSWGGSGGSSGGRWGGGSRGDSEGDRTGDGSRWGGQSIDWSKCAWQLQASGRMNSRGRDALCSLYYRSLCWISLTRCIHHVLTSQFSMLDGMPVSTRPSLARCSSVFEMQGSGFGNYGSSVALTS